MKKLHRRRIPGYNLLSLCEQRVHQSGNPVEFLNLIVLPHIGLYHAGGVYVFLNGIVQHIVLIKYLNEVGMSHFSQ